MTDIFWMIYGNGQGAPTMKHASRDDAEREAKRLARNNPGVQFYVLQTIAIAEKHDVSFTWLNRRDLDAEIPF